ncbi:OmpA family protein [Roseibium sp. TrichSKD4]|uniref:OmpA family protein n=1 Tax=Roseibium sp. TrichSKD4 TaxID=744980 RepID=UPI001AD9360B|nr:OmpA family protein [Roseibium sp. TrichSKD4]
MKTDTMRTLVVTIVMCGVLAACSSVGGFGQAGSSKPSAGSIEAFSENIGRSILFLEGSAALDENSQALLVNQATWLKTYPNWLVKIQGHADDPGTEAANKTLSTQRAEVVQAALIAQGVDAKRLWVKGYGIERPVTDCDPEACQRLNRRVVLNLRETFDDAAPQSSGKR